MAELKWEQFGRNPGFVANATIRFSGPNGENLTGTNQRTTIMLIATENMWAIRQPVPGYNPIFVKGDSSGIDNAKKLAVASVSSFVAKKMQFNHEKQVPVSWGPAHGGMLGKL